LVHIHRKVSGSTSVNLKVMPLMGVAVFLSKSIDQFILFVIENNQENKTDHDYHGKPNHEFKHSFSISYVGNVQFFQGSSVTLFRILRHRLIQPAKMEGEALADLSGRNGGS